MPDAWHLRLEPRQWQREAFAAWRTNAHRGVVSVVTGGGKTVLAYLCMNHAKAIGSEAFLIIVPTVALLDQWMVGLTDDLGVSPGEIALFGGGRKVPHPNVVNIAVINTARSAARQITESRPTFLIVDECHRIASPHNADALDGEHVATLGLSATPEREYDDLFSSVVAPALGPIIYSYDYNQARNDGVIAPFELINVAVQLSPEETAKYSDLTQRLVPLFRRRDRGDDVELQLQHLLRERMRVSTGARARLPSAMRILERHPRERVILFHEQIDAADVLTAAIAARGHRVAAYHSRIGSQLRQDNLRLFRRGEIDVLVTCRALDEGINVPDASAAIIVASTSSTRQRIQRLGRVLRQAPGKNLARVYTIYATDVEGERLRAEAENLQGAERVRWMELRDR